MLNLMAATGLIKVGTGATKGWKSKRKQLKEHVAADQVNYRQHRNIKEHLREAESLRRKDGQRFSSLRKMFHHLQNIKPSKDSEHLQTSL